MRVCVCACVCVTRELDVSHNAFSGTVPSVLSALSGLRTLWMPLNRLEGCIPDGLSQLQQLTYLDLSNNALSCDVPDGLSALTSLLLLQLNGNALTGTVPSWLADLPSLRYVLAWRHKQGVSLALAQCVSVVRWRSMVASVWFAAVTAFGGYCRLCRGRRWYLVLVVVAAMMCVLH